MFLLDSVASVCVLCLRTLTVLADHFLDFSKYNPANNDFKTLTVANKAEVPILFPVILTLQTSIQGNTRSLVIPFAVANLKHNFLGIFSLKNMSKLSILNKTFAALSPSLSPIPLNILMAWNIYPSEKY